MPSIYLSNKTPANAITGWKANLILVGSVLACAIAINLIDAATAEPSLPLQPVLMDSYEIQDVTHIKPEFIK